MVSQVMREDRVSWGGTVVLGILITAIGVMALFAPADVGYTSLLVIGILLALSGCFEVAHGLRVHRPAQKSLLLGGGLLAVVVGVLGLMRPKVGIDAVALLFGAYVFMKGLLRGIAAAVDRYPLWGWDLIYAVVAVVLGGIVLGTWPRSSAWILGTLVGIEIILRGLVLVGAGFLLRRLTQHTTA